MITSKKELKYYISEDRKRQPIERPFLSALTFSESWSVRSYLTILRHYEFYLHSFNALRNKWRFRPAWGGVIPLLHHGVAVAFYFMRWRRKSLKTGMQVFPNTCGPGLAITHQSFVHIDNLTSIGKNCSILPMVLFGKNKSGRIIVGDNVTFGCGVTVLAPCKIGNNVYVGAGAVVNKDIPDNCVIAGVPAKIIKVLKH